MVTSFTGGCPDDRSILTYSQSENPNSPYFADQTRMFSNKEWVDPPFCASEVNGGPSLTTEVIQAPATAGAKAKRRKCRPKKKKRSAVSSRRCQRKKKRR
jgi:Penicillin amidase